MSTSKVPLSTGICKTVTQSDTWFLGFTRVYISNRFTIGSSVFARFATVTNEHRRTTTRDDICSKRMHLRSERNAG